MKVLEDKKWIQGKWIKNQECSDLELRKRMDVFTEKRKERENMHLHKLTDLLSFHEVAVGGTLPQTEYYREKLKRLHPMQMLSSNILLPLYEISSSERHSPCF